MLEKIIPIIFLVLGSGVGLGSGILLRAPPEEAVDAANTDNLEFEKPMEVVAGQVKDVPVDYVKLSNQFVVPIVKEDRVSSLIVMSLSLEVPEEQRSLVFEHEPKLRDSFLEVLFDHANIGGFDGAFTATKNLEALRRALTEIGQRDIGENNVKDVLITEIARQDY